MLHDLTLKNRLGPILSDGTRVADLIDLEKREVSLRVLNDPEIHDLELRKIFAKSWVMVGHVAEIPRAGDYMLRYIGEDQVIVVRAEDGSVNILLNTCSHRAMEVCRSDHGNTNSFQCPYHGWVFDQKGALLGAPYEKIMYGDWDKGAKGYELLRAKVGVQSGIIFGNFDPDAVSLDDHLGEYKYYLDFTLGDDPEEMIVMRGLGGMGTSRLRMNWKIMNDQFCGDHYHSAGIHKNSLQSTWPDRSNLQSPYSAQVGTDGGHVLWNLGFHAAPWPISTPEETCDINGVITRVVFPANGVLGGAVGGRSAPMVNLSSFVPKGPGDTEMMGVTIMRKDAQSRRRGLNEDVAHNPAFEELNSAGPLANVFADDNTQGPSVQRAVRGVVAKNFVTMKYPGKSGDAERPMSFAGPAKDWDAESGYAYIGTQRDENQWNWWRHYFDVLTAED